MRGNYDARCDVWSCGVILYILLTGIPPFNGRNDREILDRVRKGRFNMNRRQFKQVSAAGKDLIKKMLTYDYTKRPTAAECYKHKWFKKEHASEKKKLDPQTLNNFKKFHVFFFLTFSIKTNYTEHCTSFWLITWLLRKRRNL